MPSSWVLPAGVSERLPPDAAGLEHLRREVIDRFSGWGYDLVMPPFLEYLDSLVDGTGSDLDLQTFKVIDQVSGRMLGVRADMTLQVARIDAHRLERGEAPVRLCYVGTVLHARANRLSGSRCPVQIGAELYGHPGVEGDVEMLTLMLDIIRGAGIEHPHVDVGHLGIFQGLARGAALDEAKRAALFAALQRKAQAEIEELLEGVAPPWRARLGALASLNGGPEVLDEAAERLAGPPSLPGEVEAALEELRAVAGAFARRREPVHFDLAELRGYQYHGGIGFAAFVPGHGREIARGGRYEGVTPPGGRPRPATGFSSDLGTLYGLSARRPPNPRGVLAPWPDGLGGLEAAVRERRAAGERVVYRLPGQAGSPRVMGCDREFRKQAGRWVVVPVPEGAGDG